jgi:hypothetical protein
MLLMHLFSVLPFTGIMKLLSFTILATILLALFIPSIDATSNVRGGHVEEKENIEGGHRDLPGELAGDKKKDVRE